jgi:hypothetical protein
MTIGPKMAFILRVYHMTDAESAQDKERDREMVDAGLMSERERWKRMHTRALARKIRQRDDACNWPRDVNTRPYRYRRLRDGKVGRWGEVTKDQREGDSFVRVPDEVPLHQGQTKH